MNYKILIFIFILMILIFLLFKYIHLIIKMTDNINKYIKNNGLFSLGKILEEVKNMCKIYDSPYSIPLVEKSPLSNLIYVKMYCDWTSSKDLCNLWNKMSKGN